MHSFFIRIVATLTQKPRQKIDFVWSSSYVSNVFRLWEWFAGRSVGIRCEQIVIENKVYSYTLENVLATYEGLIRAWLRGMVPRFEIVRVPQLQLAGLTQGGIQPFALAVAFDANGWGTQGASSPVTWTHVVTGSNPNLLVAWDNTGGSDVSTACTYNAAALSKLLTTTPNAFSAALWYIGNPSTGSNTVSVTLSGGVNNRSGSGSYSGCATSADNSGSTSKAGGGTSPSNLTITSVADNCWLVGKATAGDATLSAGTNTTFRSNVGDNYGIWVDGNAAITPAGASTIQVTWTGGNQMIFVGATLAPATAAAGSIHLPYLNLLGVGQ